MTDIRYGRAIPRQQDLELFIAEVRKRSLRDFTEPLRQQDISVQQQRDPFFKPIYQFLSTGYKAKLGRLRFGETNSFQNCAK